MQPGLCLCRPFRDRGREGGGVASVSPENPPQGDKQPERGGPAPRQPFRFGSPLGYVLLLVLGFFLFRSVFNDAGVRQVSYSQFRAAVARGDFAGVELAESWVKGYLAAPQSASEVDAETEVGERRGPVAPDRINASALPWRAYRVDSDEGLLPL